MSDDTIQPEQTTAIASTDVFDSPAPAEIQPAQPRTFTEAEAEQIALNARIEAYSDAAQQDVARIVRGLILAVPHGTLLALLHGVFQSLSRLRPGDSMTLATVASVSSAIVAAVPTVPYDASQEATRALAAALFRGIVVMLRPGAAPEPNFAMRYAVGEAAAVLLSGRNPGPGEHDAELRERLAQTPQEIADHAARIHDAIMEFAQNAAPQQP